VSSCRCHHRGATALLPALERTVLLLYRRHLEHHVIESIVLNTETSLEQAGLGQRRPGRPPAIAFLDLTGYTASPRSAATWLPPTWPLGWSSLSPRRRTSTAAIPSSCSATG
jgi:hypothetical protein